MNYAKPKRKSAKENAFNQIQRWIIDGTLQPGEKLNDTELAKALGVSRTPVRESLQLLEAQGFVRMYPGKATQVTEVKRETITDLLPPLAALQALSAELAVPYLTRDIINQLNQTNEEFKTAITIEDYSEALMIDESFHQLIIDAAHNPYIYTLVADLQAHVRRLFFHNSIILTEASIEEHQAIVRSLEVGDGVQAAAVMKQNWLRAIDEFTGLSNISTK